MVVFIKIEWYNSQRTHTNTHKSVDKITNEIIIANGYIWLWMETVKYLFPILLVQIIRKKHCDVTHKTTLCS